MVYEQIFHNFVTKFVIFNLQSYVKIEPVNSRQITGLKIMTLKFHGKSFVISR